MPVIRRSTATKTQITTKCRYTDKQIIAVLAIRNSASQTSLAEAALLIEVTENKRLTIVSKGLCIPSEITAVFIVTKQDNVLPPPQTKCYNKAKNNKWIRNIGCHQYFSLITSSKDFITTCLMLKRLLIKQCSFGLFFFLNKRCLWALFHFLFFLFLMHLFNPVCVNLVADHILLSCCLFTALAAQPAISSPVCVCLCV